MDKRRRNDSPERPRKRKSRFAEPERPSNPEQVAATLGLDPAVLAAKKAAIAAQMKTVSHVLAGAQSLVSGFNRGLVKKDIKPQDFTLRVDEQGRALDAHGNVVKENGPVKTLKANVQRTRVNPYLHKSADSQESDMPMDPRIKLKSRNLRAKKTFQFHKEGVFVKQDDRLQEKEHRKLVSGLTSGRNENAYVKEGMGDRLIDDELPSKPFARVQMADELPPLAEEESPVVPLPTNVLAAPSRSVPHEVEWWDVAFLPADKKKNREAQYSDANLKNSKFHCLVIHPVPVKPPGYDMKGPSLPVYLTKKERKRIRRQAREERRNELQDKIALGLVDAPEPKLKLANFMKVLGDQAVADPSKIEKKVMEQVQQRVMNHEMRNLANKLTPQELKDKRRRKLTEDTSRQVIVGLYRVKDISSTKLKFKVDMNAQQLNLTGGVLQCRGEDGEEPVTLVVVEGGPKAIKKYTRLMLRRIKWNGDEFDEDDEDSESEAMQRDGDNKCDLVWIGTVIRRSFTNFRFQECRSSSAARKVLESKGVPHYWDMIARGDKIDETEYI